MSRHLERAQLLMEQRRITEAEKELALALQESPDNGAAFRLLALCKVMGKNYPAALAPAQQALAIDPDDPGNHYILAVTYFYNNQNEQAKQLISSGLSLNPYMPSMFELAGEIALHEDQWQEALYHAEKGLEIDPEDTELVNLRARALIKLNRTAEAEATMDYALYTDPHNSMSHANQGWVAVHQNHFDQAIASFQEALRLNPQNAHAREGLKEAIKAKNPLYRGILNYFLWMSKLQSDKQWWFIIGMYFVYRIVLSLNKNYPALSFLLTPIIVLYILFAYSTWIGQPVSNFFLRFHPLGKHALSEDENRAASWVGIQLLALLAVAVLYWLAPEVGWGVWSKDRLFFAVLVVGTMLIPVSGSFLAPQGSPARKQLSWFAIVLAFLGFLPVLFPAAFVLIFIYGIGIFIYGFAANFILHRAARRF